MSEYGTITRERDRDDALCLWCGQVVTWDAPADRTDPRQVGDWNIGGDSGCGDSPETDEDGTGGHITLDDVRALLADQDSEGLGRIFTAMANMPYMGGSLRGGYGFKSFTLAGLAGDLEALRDTLERHATEDGDNRTELANYRRDVAALRRVLGTVAAAG